MKLLTLKRSLVQAIELLLLLGCVTRNAGAQERSTRQATDAEAAAGTDVKAYINPKQLQTYGGGGGGPTNGATLTQVTNVVSDLARQTNTAFTIPEINTSSNLVWRMFTNALQSGLTNVTVGTLATRGATNGAAVTNLVGLNIDGGIQYITVGANLSYDAPTRTLSATGGGGGSDTPWTLDHDASNHKLINVSLLTLTNLGVAGEFAVGLAADNTVVVTLGAISNNVAAISTFAASNLVANTASIGTGNFTVFTAGTSWLTNTVVPTNAFAGTVVDFAQGDGLTNLGGNLTFTAVANVTAGGANSRIVRLLSGGADRTVAFPASWHTNYNFQGVVTNAGEMDLLFTVLPGIRTNVAQIFYP